MSLQRLTSILLWLAKRNGSIHSNLNDKNRMWHMYWHGWWTNNGSPPPPHSCAFESLRKILYVNKLVLSYHIFIFFLRSNERTIWQTYSSHRRALRFTLTRLPYRMTHETRDMLIYGKIFVCKQIEWNQLSELNQQQCLPLECSGCDYDWGVVVCLDSEQ